MSRVILLSLFSFLLADVSFAQKSMMAGKIVSEDGMPIAGAKIEMKRGHKVTTTKSDNDGLFYSQLLPVGYYHIRVVAGGKYMRAKTVYLPDETKKKDYFYLRVVGGKVVVAMDAENPFLKAHLTGIENDKYNIIGNDKYNIIDAIGNWSIEAINQYNIIDGINPRNIVTIKFDTTGNAKNQTVYPSQTKAPH
jgi:hypothetical protein